MTRGKGVKTLCKDRETFSSQWRFLFKGCTFYTYENTVPDLDRNPFGFDSGGEILSFPHTCVRVRVLLQGFVCFAYNLVTFSLIENATHVFKKKKTQASWLPL